MNSSIQSTVTDLKKYFKHILIVDDYSKEKVSNLKFPSDTYIVRHQFNTGQGGAIQTGIYAFREHFKNLNYFITFDADGQHRASTLLMLKKLKRKI